MEALSSSVVAFQARVEIGLLQLLNTRCDPSDERHIVRMVDYFLFCKHLCLVFEKLDVNLFELLKRNAFRGLSLSLVQVGSTSS
jgi:dual specificity protein kinase YAK1